MTNGFNEILLQASYYLIVMILSMSMAGVLLKGFFWKFIRVRLSFGKFIMVKIRAVNRDYYRVGKVDENDLIYKVKAGDKRITIPGNSAFYRSLGITWIDVDDEKNAIIKPDLSIVTGFDAIKNNNLLVRALTGPDLNDNRERIIIIIAFITVIGLAIIGFLVYKQGIQIQTILNSIGGLNRGVLVAGG